jgi:hypothetical protein
MTPWNLRQRLKAAIKGRLSLTLDAKGARGELSLREHEAIFALFQTITDDPEFPFDRYRSFVDGRTREVPGTLQAYRRSIMLLDRLAARMRAGHSFALLPLEERDRALRRLLRPYPHPEQEPAWRRLTRLTSRNVHLLLDGGARRALRHQVIRDLLGWYFTTERGWGVVGWTEFPGKAGQR